MKRLGHIAEELFFDVLALSLEIALFVFLGIWLLFLLGMPLWVFLTVLILAK